MQVEIHARAVLAEDSVLLREGRVQILGRPVSRSSESGHDGDGPAATRSAA